MKMIYQKSKHQKVKPKSETKVKQKRNQSETKATQKINQSETKETQKRKTGRKIQQCYVLQ